MTAAAAESESEDGVGEEEEEEVESAGGLSVVLTTTTKTVMATNVMRHEDSRDFLQLMSVILRGLTALFIFLGFTESK